MRRNYGKSFVLVKDRAAFLQLPTDLSKRKQASSLLKKEKKQEIFVPKFTVIAQS